MTALAQLLNGKKTYLVGAIMVLASGLHAQGYITSELLNSIEGVLLGTGLMTLRAGVSKSA